MLESYCGDGPGRIREVIAAIDEASWTTGSGAEYLREMKEGLAPVFERIWQEGEWRSLDIRALEHVIGPAFLPHWRRQEHPYDGDPYPIDGCYYSSSRMSKQKGGAW